MSIPCPPQHASHDTGDTAGHYGLVPSPSSCFTRSFTWMSIQRLPDQLFRRCILMSTTDPHLLLSERDAEEIGLAWLEM